MDIQHKVSKKKENFWCRDPLLDSLNQDKPLRARKL